MAQDILITPGSGEPQILFRGSGTNDTPLELNVLSSYQSASTSGTALIFEGTEGQLFSITDNLSSGVIFSVPTISGDPFFEVYASGDVRLIESGRYVGIGTGVPSYELDVFGTGRFSSGIVFPDGVRQIIAYTGQVGGGTSYTAGSGLTLDGDEFNVYGGTGHFIRINIQAANTSIFRNQVRLNGGTLSSILLGASGSLVAATTTGIQGNQRGINCVDLQIAKTGETQIAEADYSVICGGRNNSIGAGSDYSWIGGGLSNSIGINSTYSCIGGGQSNSISSSDYSVIGGGKTNTINGGQYNVIVGGLDNIIRASSNYCSVLGGRLNEASGTDAAVLGGQGCKAGDHSVVIGNNSRSYGYSTVIGTSNFSKQAGSAFFNTHESRILSSHEFDYYSLVLGRNSYCYANNSVAIGAYNYIATTGCSSTILGSFCYNNIRGQHSIGYSRFPAQSFSTYDSTQQRSTFIVGAIDNDTGNPPSRKYLTTLGRYAGTGDHPGVNLQMPNQVNSPTPSVTGSTHSTWSFDFSMSIIDATSGNHGSYNVKGAVGGYGNNSGVPSGTPYSSGYIRIIGTGEPERYMEGPLTGIQVFVEGHTGTHSLMFSVIGISGLETRYSASVDVQYCQDYVASP
jgi:hypothetical protein